MRLFMLPLTGGGVSVDLVGIPLLDGNRSPDRSRFAHHEVTLAEDKRQDDVFSEY